MEVELVSYTPNPEKAIIEAAAVSYRSKPRNEILDHIISAGHFTPLEFAVFGFKIEGISRACSHQLVRKRVGVAFVQESQRYVSYDEGFYYVTPSCIEKHPEGAATYKNAMLVAHAAYRQLRDLGIPAEDARFVLPNACTTIIYMSANYHALLDLSKERLCGRAQWEIQELMNLVKNEIAKVSPKLANHMQPKCHWLGKCPEKKPCRKGVGIIG